MRALMISDVYFPRINGVSTSIETFRHALTEHNVGIHVLAPAYPGDQASHDQVSRVVSRRVPFDPEDRLMQAEALKRALHALDDQHFDLVHIQTPFAAHYAGLRYARDRGIPCVATYHTHFEEYLHNYVPVLPRGLLRGIARRVARQQCNALDAVIVPSRAMRETLTDYGISSPMHQVPTGIPVEHFRRPAGTKISDEFRKRHSIPQGSPVALFVGRTAHEKNIGFLIDALPHALRYSASMTLVIAGEGPALNALRQKTHQLGLDEKVRFVGYLDRHNELPACYAASDLFVFASRTETQGLVLLEAMAAGLPVLAFSYLGTKEIIEPKRGAIPAPEDPVAFGEAMAKLANNPALRRKMSEEGMAFVAEWTTDACAGKLAKTYQQILDAYAAKI